MICLVANYRYSAHPAEHGLDMPFWREVRRRAGPLHVVVRGPTDRVETDEREGIRFTLFPAAASNASFVWHLRRWLVAQSAPSLYWVSDAAVSDLAVGPVARRRGVPYLVELQGNFFSADGRRDLRGAVARRLALAAARRATRVRVCCRAHVDLLAACGVDPARIAMVPTRVDASRFDPLAFDRGAARRAYGIDERTVAVVSVASLVPRKGLRHAIEALASLPTNATLLVAGDGPQREALAGIAQAAGVADRVRWLGRLRHEAVATLMRAADVFVLPSFNEGMPRVVNEAQAMGLPVVASDVDGIAEQIVPGATGLLVRPGDSRGLASALRVLVDDPARRASMAGAARAHVVGTYSFDAVMDRWQAVLDGLLARRV